MRAKGWKWNPENTEAVEIKREREHGLLEKQTAQPRPEMASESHMYLYKSSECVGGG